MDGAFEPPAPRPSLLPPGERAQFRAKVRPEDFEVVEIPVAPPSGDGRFVWLWIEKRGLSTEDALARIARLLGVGRQRAAHAGRKDVAALTRQWFAFDGAERARAEALLGDVPLGEGAGDRALRVLAASAHPRGLRPGATRGNHFRLVLRDVEVGGFERLERGLDALVERGTPAWYGEQRFGHGGRGAAVGLALLSGMRERFTRLLVGAPCDADHGRVRAAREAADSGDFASAAREFPGAYALERAACRALTRGAAPERVPEELGRRELAFLVAAGQAALFDRVLARRFPHLDELRDGDVAYLHASRGSFHVDDAAAERSRAARLELSPTGPVFGRRMRPRPSGAPAADEEDALAWAGLTLEAFERPLPSRQGGWRVDGARRPLRWPLADARLEALDGTTARVEFTLPPGGYATEVLAELGGGVASAANADDLNGDAAPG